MAKRKNNKRHQKKNVSTSGNGFIKLPEGERNINQKDIERISYIDYPLFSFKYLQEVSFVDKSIQIKFFQTLLIRLKKYSELGWNGMSTSRKHDYGWEYLPQEQMKQQLPSIITPEVDLMILRSSNDNRSMVGFREWNIFHVIFIEAIFNDIYNHSN